MASASNTSILFLLVILASVQYSYTMSEAQMQSAAKLIRNVCQPKNKVTDAQIEEFHKGKFDGDHKMGCYMSCVLGMAKLLKNNKFDVDSAMSQIATIPKTLQASTGAAINHCAGAGTSTEKCEHAYQISQCMFEFDPVHYFLP